MRVLPSGPGAILAEYDSLAEVMSVDDALRNSGLAGIDDVIPAARTVLVTFRQDDLTGGVAGAGSFSRGRS
jgi:allophanate hydrolase subunit 1